METQNGGSRRKENFIHVGESLKSWPQPQKINLRDQERVCLERRRLPVPNKAAQEDTEWERKYWRSYT